MALRPTFSLYEINPMSVIFQSKWSVILNWSYEFASSKILILKLAANHALLQGTRPIYLMNGILRPFK